MTNYIMRAKELVTEELIARKHSVTEPLLDFYTCLAMTVGEHVTLEMVHDCWALARTKTNPTHPNLVPFKELDAKTQAIDQDYADAIKAAALRINAK